MCTVLLPPGDNPIAVNKYIISYHVMGHIISYHVMGRDDIYPGRMSKVGCLGRPYWMYIIPTHDTHQWLLLQFLLLLMIDLESVGNM